MEAGRAPVGSHGPIGVRGGGGLLVWPLKEAPQVLTRIRTSFLHFFWPARYVPGAFHRGQNRQRHGDCSHCKQYEPASFRRPSSVIFHQLIGFVMDLNLKV